MNSAAQNDGANMYHAVKNDGTELITSDLWEAVKHCDPELKHNDMCDSETHKPIGPMEFKNSGNGSVLSICISTRKKYARKFDRNVLGTVRINTVGNHC